jgi:hypothetical protein
MLTVMRTIPATAVRYQAPVLRWRRLRARLLQAVARMEERSDDAMVPRNIVKRNPGRDLSGLRAERLLGSPTSRAGGGSPAGMRASHRMSLSILRFRTFQALSHGPASAPVAGLPAAIPEGGPCPA